MKPENKEQLAKAIKTVGQGCFSEINGTVFGFDVTGSGVAVFDTQETDDYRIERFPSAEKAIDGFKIGGKPLASFIGNLEITPCLSV